MLSKNCPIFFGLANFPIFFLLSKNCPIFLVSQILSLVETAKMNHMAVSIFEFGRNSQNVFELCCFDFETAQILKQYVCLFCVDLFRVLTYFLTYFNVLPISTVEIDRPKIETGRFRTKQYVF